MVKSSDLGVLHTPCVLAADTTTVSPHSGMFLDCSEHCSSFQPLPGGLRLHLKLENMQTTGSFKIRGVANQLTSGVNNQKKKCYVTMSAGNYGRTFAHAAQKLGFAQHATVLMPDTAPQNRADLIQKCGLKVDRMPSADLMRGVAKYEQQHGAVFLHPFDDIDLIAGHASLGLELMQDVKDVDIVLVCCGGGGLLAGVATAIATFPNTTSAKVYGIEPEKACGMHKSMRAGTPAKCPEARSVASGLAPPFAGSNAFLHVHKYVQDIILVSESEIIGAVKAAFNHGLVVEPAGAAGLAAVLSGKLEDKEGGKGSLCGKNVVVVLTGGNVSPQELVDLY